jgi:ankyrin repeat protein
MIPTSHPSFTKPLHQASYDSDMVKIILSSAKEEAEWLIDARKDDFHECDDSKLPTPPVMPPAPPSLPSQQEPYIPPPAPTQVTTDSLPKALESSRRLLALYPLPTASHKHFSKNELHTADGHGNTPLHWCAFKNAADCVKLLLANGANVNGKAGVSGWTPLHDAAYSDAVESLDLLLAAGADVDARATSGATPLCFAAQEDAPNAARTLLEAGAEASARCLGGTGLSSSRFSGYTPLHYCGHYNAFRAAKVLIQYGAGLEVRDVVGRLPIHIATARGSSDVLKELLRAGANVVQRDNKDTQTTNGVGYFYDDSNGSVTMVESGTGMDGDGNGDENNEMDGVVLTVMPPPPPTGNGGHVPMFAEMGTNTGNNSIIDNDNGNINNGAPALVLPPPIPSTVNTAAAPFETPPTSPQLASLVPRRPVQSTKPWNCVTQAQIDSCLNLLTLSASAWSPKANSVFEPVDRRGVLEVLRVAKRMEQACEGLRILDMWPLILGFCGRGWFKKSEGTQQTATCTDEMHVGEYTLDHGADAAGDNELDDFRLLDDDDDDDEEGSGVGGGGSSTSSGGQFDFEEDSASQGDEEEQTEEEVDE